MQRPTEGSPARGPDVGTLSRGLTAGLTLLALLIVVGGCQADSPARAPKEPSRTPTSLASQPAQASPTPARSSTAPSPAPPSREPRPRSTSPDPPNRSLKSNTVYRLDLDDRALRCELKVRSPRTPLKNADLAPYLRTVVTCLVKAFKRPLADQGFTLTTPKLKTYRSRVSTPCGKFGQDIAPAYYCSRNQTIYFPSTRDNGREAYTIARLGYVGLVAHEFGHHLQGATGILNGYGADYYATKKKGTRYALSRRLELQAQCFEGVFLAVSAKKIKLSATDRQELRAWHGYTGDEDPPKDRIPDHGTSAAQLRWLDRGLDSADFGRCNTWDASSKSVR